MKSLAIETKYPLSFRSEDARKLGEHLRLRHSVEIVGIKRVGISDFLRFFLNRPGIVQKYIDKQKFHLFVAIDLNDLVELEIYPFWILTLKRINDAVELFDVEAKLKKEISNLFLSSIQANDLFLTIENTRLALTKLIAADIFPTIFFIRFDRIISEVGQEFFANLESIVDASNHHLSFVFTSFRKIDEIKGEKLPRNFLHVFSNILYVKCANFSDSKTIFDTLKRRYGSKIGGSFEKKIIELSGGHVQYLHLLLLILVQRNVRSIDEIVDLASVDERISLQSEEIWESLTLDEKNLVMKVFEGEVLKREDLTKGKYLQESGIIKSADGDRKRGFGLRKGAKPARKEVYELFSPLFAKYVAGQIAKGKNGEEAVDFTKKENDLFNLLKDNLDNVCEREKIIESVWPEEEEMGVSDWTVDRLVARLREKLKRQESKYQIVTIKTRGFKLTTG